MCLVPNKKRASFLRSLRGSWCRLRHRPGLALHWFTQVCSILGKERHPHDTTPVPRCIGFKQVLPTPAIVVHKSHFCRDSFSLVTLLASQPAESQSSCECQTSITSFSSRKLNEEQIRYEFFTSNFDFIGITNTKLIQFSWPTSLESLTQSTLRGMRLRSTGQVFIE